MDDVKCVHCGDNCDKYPVIWENKNFCCRGCLSVYRILSENRLSGYYSIYQNPGIKITDEKENRFNYLDNPEVKEKLIDFSDGQTTRVCFYIPSIHCSSCVWLLEHLNRLDKNILGSSVNFGKKEVTITFNEEKLSLSSVAAILSSIHYSPEITLDNLEKKKSSTVNKSLLYKIGIAGFAFGNIMIYSLPAYLPGKELIESQYKNVFASLSFILSIPVVAYCANDYLISAFKNLKKRIFNLDLPIALGVLALFLQSSFSFFFHTSEHLYFDSLSGLVFFLLIGKWYQGKTYSALSFERDYKSYFPVAVTRLDNGREITTLLKDLKKKDIIIIRNRELVPTDGTLLSEEAHIDYSFVTGESRPVIVKKNEPVYAGGRQTGPAIMLEIQKEVEQSRLTKLWNEENYKKNQSHVLNRIIDKISFYFIFVILGISLTAAVIWLFVDASKALPAAISVLIVACPCALALAMPFAFGNAMRLLGKKGFYLKKTEVVEDFSSFDTIVFDKTGTLTETRHSVTGFIGKPLDKGRKTLIVSLVKNSTHPLSAALFNEFKNIQTLPVTAFKEIPSEGISGKVNGIAVKAGNANFVNAKAQPGETNAGSRVFVSFDGQYVGYFLIENKLRDKLEEVTGRLESYFLHVISGDNDYDKSRLQQIFPPKTQFHFNLSPMDKKNYVTELKNRGHRVLMIGDGLNDAGALRESNAGISIADNIFVFSPASDAILEASSFKLLPVFFRYFRQSLNIVKISYIISFLYNIFGIYFAVRAMLSPILAAILMPLSSVSVVLFTTMATSLFFKKVEKQK